MTIPTIFQSSMSHMLDARVLLAQFEAPEGGDSKMVYFIVSGIILFFVMILVIMILNFGAIWLQAYMSNARVGFFTLLGMKLRQVHLRTIVDAKIMAMQAGVGTDPTTGITTKRLEAHFLADGDVPRVISAIVAAQRADIDLDFDKAD